MNEELKKLAEKYNWKLEVQHGEYKGILCGVQEIIKSDNVEIVDLGICKVALPV